MDKFIQLVTVFDASVLAVYQKISNWFQKIFGLTNFALARVCLMYLCVENLILFVIGIAVLKDFGFITVILMFIVGVLLCFGFRICARSEKVYYTKTKNNFLNKNEKTLLKWRIFSVVFCVFRIIVFTQILVTNFSVELVIIYGLLTCHNMIVVHFFYFVSCTPLPPGESKVKAKLKKLKEKVSEFLSPLPGATPA